MMMMMMMWTSRGPHGSIADPNLRDLEIRRTRRTESEFFKNWNLRELQVASFQESRFHFYA
jgi:hypothetical protein